MSTPVGAYLALLGRYLRPQWRRVIALALLLIATMALQLLGPQIVRTFIDTALGGPNSWRALNFAGLSPSLAIIAVLFLVAAVAGQAVSLAELYTAESLAWIATNRLRADLLRHCLGLDMGFHQAHTPGEMIERVDGDVSLLANFFSRMVVQVLGNVLLLVGILALLFSVHWLVGTTFTGFAILAFAVLSRVQGLAAPRWVAARQASADLFGFLEERLSGTEDVRSAGAAPYMVRGLLARMRDLLRRERRAALLSGVLGNTLNVTMMLGMGAAFILGAALFRDGTITLGTVYLILSYTELLRRPIDQINRNVQDLQQATAGIARIHQLLATQDALPEPVSSASHSIFPPGPLTVELDHVTFGYDGYDAGEPVLHDVCMVMPAGKVLGVVGRTGSGKSTIARLLFRLYDPQAGAVRLDGVDVRDLPRTELTRRVGMVTQEVELFHATVRDNVTFFDRTIDDAAILTALRNLGLDGWYRTLPKGLDTWLAGSSGLSAGEAQLLAFVRVFLKDPGLVILDEATARLDPATEMLLERAVTTLLRERTGIVIAHRLDTLRRADDVLLLERGRVVEYGPRIHLADDPRSRFAGLLRTASAGVIA